MRPHRLTATLAALLFAGLATAASPPGGADPNALDLARAERSFADLSQATGVRQAFLANLCEDGIVFRPGPVNGRETWRAQPESRSTLRWAPEWVEVAGDGDLGLSTGPWEFLPESSATPAAFGHFVSIWRRGADSTWCVALDIGITHPGSSPTVDSVELRTAPARSPSPPRPKRTGLVGLAGGVFGSHSGVGVGVGVGTRYGTLDERERQMAHEIHDMMSAERALAFDIRGKGVPRAYPIHAAEDVRFCREGAPPTVGIAAAAAAGGSRPEALEWRPYGRAMSTSLDLGYSYGLGERRLAGAARPDTSAYLHVWRRDREGRWMLALDIETPLQPR